MFDKNLTPFLVLKKKLSTFFLRNKTISFINKKKKSRKMQTNLFSTFFLCKKIVDNFLSYDVRKRGSFGLGVTYSQKYC
jgi:hypothetical protein